MRRTKAKKMQLAKRSRGPLFPAKHYVGFMRNRGMNLICGSIGVVEGFRFHVSNPQPEGE